MKIPSNGKFNNLEDRIAQCEKQATQLIDTKITTERTLEPTFDGGLKVHSVSGGECQQFTTTGSNLFNAKTLNLNSNDTLEVSDDGYKIVATGGVNSTYTRSEAEVPLNNVLGKTVYLTFDSAEKTYGSTTNWLVQGEIINEDNTATYCPVKSSGIATMVVPATAKKVTVAVYTNNTSSKLTEVNTVTVKGLRIVEATDAPWEPYTGGIASPNPEYPQEIESTVISKLTTYGNNLLNVQGMKLNTNDTLEVSDDGYTIVATGGANGRSSSYLKLNIQRFKGKKIYFEADSIISKLGYDVSKCAIQLMITPANGANLYYNVTPNNLRQVIRVSDDVKSISFSVITNNSSGAIGQTEEVTFKGARVTVDDSEWIPFETISCQLSEPITLNKIGDYGDKIVEKNGLWCTKRLYKNGVIDETILSTFKTGSVGPFLAVPLNDLDISDHSTPVALCNKFKSMAYDDRANYYTAFRTYQNGSTKTLYFVAPQASTISTKEEFSELVGMDTAFIYRLSEPIYEPLPEADQIALNSLRTFDGTTHIFTDATIEPIVEVEYGLGKVGALELEVDLNKWDHTQNKISSILGLTAEEYGGNAKTATLASTADGVTISSGTSDTERPIVVNNPTSSTKNIFTVPGITANYSKKTLTAEGGFIGNLKGKADTAAMVERAVTDNTDVPIWKVHASNDGEYGYRLQYNGSGSGNDNSLNLITNNQTGDEVVAMTMLQDGTTTFTKQITASGGIKGNLIGNADTVSAGAVYGTCSTEAATAAKVITITGNDNWKLKTGSIIVVKFSATNTAQNPTFNVNGTGAKPVWYNTAVITTRSLSMAGTANIPMIFMYDGTQFVFLGWSYDANTTYSNASLGQGYATCSTAAATVAKVATLSSYALITGGIVAVKFTNAVPANATLNINSKGAKAIYYKGKAITAGLINAGDTAYFIYSSQYHLLGIDRLSEGTSFKVVTGTYTGNGAGNALDDSFQEINIGAEPFVVFIGGNYPCMKNSLFSMIGNGSGNTNSKYILTSTGFKVSRKDNAGELDRSTNVDGVVYNYTALVKG